MLSIFVTFFSSRLLVLQAGHTCPQNFPCNVFMFHFQVTSTLNNVTLNFFVYFASLLLIFLTFFTSLQFILTIICHFIFICCFLFHLLCSEFFFLNFHFRLYFSSLPSLYLLSLLHLPHSFFFSASSTPCLLSLTSLFHPPSSQTLTFTFRHVLTFFTDLLSFYCLLFTPCSFICFMSLLSPFLSFTFSLHLSSLFHILPLRHFPHPPFPLSSLSTLFP